MGNRFTGETEPLTYAGALAEIAKATSWPSEQHRDDVVKAILVEHGEYVVPEAETRALELERLRVLVAQQEADAKAAAEEVELAELRAKLGIVHGPAAADPDTPQA